MQLKHCKTWIQGSEVFCNGAIKVHPIKTHFFTFEAQATTGGGSAFENKYGLDLCRRRSISSLLPAVYPPAAPPKQTRNKGERFSLLVKIRCAATLRPNADTNSIDPNFSNHINIQLNPGTTNVKKLINQICYRLIYYFLYIGSIVSRFFLPLDPL